MSRKVILNSLLRLDRAKYVRSIWLVLVLRLKLFAAQTNEFGFRDSGDAADGLQDRRGNFAVKPNERNRLRAAGRFPAAERKCGDVYAQLSQRRAHLADDAGLVAVTQIENRPFELGLQRNAVNLEDAGRGVVQNGAFGGKALSGARFLRQRGNLKVRADATVLVRRERREIYSVADQAVRKIIAHLHGDLGADFFLRFCG